MPAKTAAMPAGKCNCNKVYVLVSMVLMSLGLFVLVKAFASQLGMVAVDTMTAAIALVPWYFVGVLLVMLGKMAKCKAGCMCSLHGMKK